jgi:hypothetical protein
MEEWEREHPGYTNEEAVQASHAFWEMYVKEAERAFGLHE